MQPATSNNNLQPIFLHHVYNQAGFEKPFVNGRDFFYLDISKMSFTFLSICKSSRWRINKDS